jgi:hypothetical protein
MKPRPFAWTAGAILVLIGVAGFAPPPIVTVEADPLRIATGVDHPQLLGLFGVSPLLNIIHLALGVWGLISGRSLNGALTYARQVTFAGFLLTVFGVIPGLDTLFGLAPLYGNNLLLHALLAITGFLFGWLYRRPPAVPDRAEDDDEAYEG